MGTDFFVLLEYLTIAACVGFPAIGVGFGQGKATVQALEAFNRQPRASNQIRQVWLLGMALMETSAVVGLLMALVLIFGQHGPYFATLGRIGIAFAIAIPGFVVGLLSSWVTGNSCLAIARQPFSSTKISNVLLITQSLLETPLILGLIISILINKESSNVHNIIDVFRLLGSGMCIGLGSLGPTIGLARFAKVACEGVGINKNAYNKIVPFTFLSEAMIETPLIFALIVSLFVLRRATLATDTIITGVAILSACLCTGIGTLMPSISSGKSASAACRQIAFHPEQYPVLSRASIVGQVFLDTFSIYAALTSLLMIILVQ